MTTQRIKKAVIPVAGLGTRMLPATKAIAKEMLTVVDKPLIQYIIEECHMAGIEEVVLVTHSTKSAIENHFDVDYELEHLLEIRGKQALLEEVRTICPEGMTIMSVRQGVAHGLGHAVQCARGAIGEEPFVVILPDVLMADYSCDLSQENLAKMIQRYQDTGASQVMVESVADEEVSAYGIADIGGVDLPSGASAKINSMVEKPAQEDAPSNLAVTGRYVLSEKIWPLLSKAQKGAGGEIQLTDAIDALILEDRVEAFCMTGESHDCGSRMGYLMATVAFARHHKKYGEAFEAELKALL